MPRASLCGGTDESNWVGVNFGQSSIPGGRRPGESLLEKNGIRLAQTNKWLYRASLTSGKAHFEKTLIRDK